MAPMEFDEDQFAEEIRTLFFERSREAAEQKENILIAQVRILVEQALRREQAYRRLAGSPGMVRLAKLTANGEDSIMPEAILDRAAALIEKLEKDISIYAAMKRYEDDLREAAG